MSTGPCGVLLHAGHDPFELGLAHAEAIVLHGKGAISLIEEDTREQRGRAPSVPGWNDHVVKLNTHHDPDRITNTDPRQASADSRYGS